MHMVAIGKSGSGKSSLLELLIRQDIDAGRGCALVEPHGDLAERVLAYGKARAPERLVYLDAADISQPFGYNPLRKVRDDKIPLAAAGLIETMKKLWPDAWGVRMEHLLRNSLYALLERDSATLPDILRLYSDDVFRRSVSKQVWNPVVRQYWLQEFEGLPERLKSEAAAPIQNKLGSLLTDPRLYKILVAPSIDIRFRKMMDEGGIFIVNLAKGRLGEDAANILGSLLVTTIGLAAMGRAEMPPDTRRPFFLYVDEFQSFTTLAFANMLAELRKSAIGLVLCHQHLDQIKPDVRHAVFGNVGTLISFRLSAEDAVTIARELQPTFAASDLISLANRDVRLRLMIDGTPSMPFSAQICAL